MSDLVKRLRLPNIFAEPAETQRRELVMASAADRIEELEQQVRRLEALVDVMKSVTDRRVIELEDALHRIRDVSHLWTGSLASQVNQIAREGLRGRDE